MPDLDPLLSPEHRQRLVHLADPEGVTILPAEERAAIAAALAELERLRHERDQCLILAAEMRRQRDDLEYLRDALECLDRIGQMVGFGEASRGPDDRQRLVREVREALETACDGRTDAHP